MANILDLPNELSTEILTYLSRDNLKGFRLVCSTTNILASPLIFTTACVAARRGVLGIFKAITAHPTLSKHVIEIVFDCSWFDPHIVELYALEKNSEQHDNYTKAFHEQERILAQEMSLALFNAVRAFTKLRRVICADYYRFSGFLGDRLEDLGPEFRLEGDDLSVQKLLQSDELECYHPSLTIEKLYEDKDLRRRYWPLTYLLRTLAGKDIQAKVEDIRLGDSMYSRDAEGVLPVQLGPLSDLVGHLAPQFTHLRKLDVTLCYRETSRPSPQALLPHIPQLELLRVVGPMCSPFEQKYAPPRRHPTIDLPDICKELEWPKLKALELKWISSHSRDLLMFLERHKYSLQFINIYEMYMKDCTAWPSLTGYLRYRHADIVLDRPIALYYNPLIINYTLYDGEATCTNTGHANYDHKMLEDYDEDQVSSYSKNEGFDETKEEERYSSEELDFSEGGDEREWEGWED